MKTVDWQGIHLKNNIRIMLYRLSLVELDPRNTAQRRFFAGL
jgi:hypothetical protein